MSTNEFKIQLFQEYGKSATAMLGSKQAGDQYLASVYQAVIANPKLLKADRSSLFGAIGTAVSLGLSIIPALGEAWLIPRGRKIDGRWMDFVNFQIGYKGLVKFMHRSDDVDSLFCEVAYEGEAFAYRGGTSPAIEHLPDVRGELRTNNSDDMVAAYAVAWLRDRTQPLSAVVLRSELLRVRDSTGSDATRWREAKPYTDVWRDHAEAMAKKTALIRLAKLMPREDQLREFHRAVGAEQAITVTHEQPDAVDAGALPIPGSDAAEISVADSKWSEATEAFLGLPQRVTTDQMLGFLGRSNPSEVSAEDHDRLLEIYRRLKGGATLEEIAAADA